MNIRIQPRNDIIMTSKTIIKEDHIEKACKSRRSHYRK